MSKPRSISTAPRDGTVILTENGLARTVRQYESAGGLRAEWVNCSPQGETFNCADYGPATCSPHWWTPVPAWITSGGP